MKKKKRYRNNLRIGSTNEKSLLCLRDPAVLLSENCLCLFRERKTSFEYKMQMTVWEMQL